MLRFVIGFLFVLLFFSSCTVIKNMPANQPFVYQNHVVLSGDMPKDEKKRLITELDHHWDDSLKARWQRQFSLRWNEIGFVNRLQSPPVFDTANITRTKQFMNAYLNAQGYYYVDFKDSVRIDTVRKKQTEQWRANVNMYVQVGRNIKIDSVAYEMNDSTLQQLTIANQKKIGLQKGNPYSIQIINQALDRLAALYRKNGYYYFTRDNLYALVDSVDASLLTLTLDPFRQAQIIAEAARNRRIDPKWDITIVHKPKATPQQIRQYYIGKIYFYPETKLSDVPDSMLLKADYKELRRRELIMRYTKGTFQYQPLRDHSYFRTGDLYNENTYFKTINTLNQIGAWKQVDGLAIARGKDSLDIHYFLVPEVKQSYQLGIESSLNTADIGTGNLMGVSGSFKYTNRNVWKRAIQSLTTLSTGVELNIFHTDEEKLAQTVFINLGHTYSFPKLILPFKSTRLKLSRLDNKRTLFFLNGSYVNRVEYYRLRSLVANWGYEWKKDDVVWLYRPINIELYSIDQFPKLEKLILDNPFLYTSFNEGNVISQKLSWTKNFTSLNDANKTKYLLFDVEEAGGLFGLIPGLKNNIYRYFKLGAEYKEQIRFEKTELVWRGVAGVGYNYGSDTSFGQTLPFFKQFFAGGPNSMRAWRLRQLGLGSSTLSEADTSSNSFRDRFGDMRFEANIEYRFPLTTIGGVTIGSVLFADIGNVWNIQSDDFDPNAQFNFKNVYRDLAVGIGTGLRIDISYFLLRLDLGYKVKDPTRPTKNGWMDGFKTHETRPNGLRINNYALQLGIGLPF